MNTRQRSALFVGLLFWVGLCAGVAARPAIQESRAVAGLSAERYQQRVNYLASDELAGRASGSPELEKAADYIAAQFRDLGLKPGGDRGTYFQTFELTTGIKFGPSNALTLDGVPLASSSDFVPIAFSSAESVSSSLVFAGYGITAPELHWDDYAGVDVKGKVVVVFRHEPQELDPKSPFDGTNNTRHATFINKAVNARQHQARGIIFMTDPVNHTADPDTVGEATRNAESDNTGIVAMHVRQAPILAAFQKIGKDLAAIQRQMDRDLKPQSFEAPNIRVRLTADLQRVRKPVRNVVATLTGSDARLRNEWIVVGAHYDHLGLGDQHSLAPSEIGRIHHGADDNASGSAGVMEFAAAAAKNPQAFKRSLMFVTFAGEELGLLGSGYFVGHPLAPLDKITAMLNFDMIGRMKDDRLFIGGVGTAAPFKGWLEEASQPLGVKLDYSESGNASSDHASFVGKHVPVLFFFTGLHADYHRPSDTADKINPTGAIEVVTLAYRVALRIADEPVRLTYVEVVEPTRAAGTGSGGGYGPYFGSVPDFSDDAKGVLFADVRAGSPAAKAGLKAGDLMTEFDHKPIGNLYDFTYALQSKQAGDIVEVVIERAGQKTRVNVTLGIRQ
ncbi:MAG TPA: M28 family peptidase [Terriglobia bacterium]|nr:M28 family peptidase [Terriglobia bacterium]